MVQSCREIGTLKMKEGSMKALRHSPEIHKNISVLENHVRMKQKAKGDTKSTVVTVVKIVTQLGAVFHSPRVNRKNNLKGISLGSSSM